MMNLRKALGLAFVHFQVMSNELSTPDILVCPYDDRLPAKDFRSSFSNTHLSYFVGLDATDANPQIFLSGDRNLTNGLPLTNHIMPLRTNSFARWTKELHNGEGNVLLSDGSVQQVTGPGLIRLIQNTGSTNRLAIP